MNPPPGVTTCRIVTSSGVRVSHLTAYDPDVICLTHGNNYDACRRVANKLGYTQGRSYNNTAIFSRRRITRWTIHEGRLSACVEGGLRVTHGRRSTHGVVQRVSSPWGHQDILIEDIKNTLYA